MANVDLTKMSAEELAQLIVEARKLRASKVTPSQKVAAYVKSIQSHKNAILVAYKRLMDCEGVSQNRWEEVGEALAALESQNIRENAEKVKVPTRKPRAKK